ncbi:MAG: hypothetical protein MUF71_16195 [Candidatus Kapabacteria bacterium]|jgi:uncharacterized protein YoxC|nr:hypothetical protein [Candidatus Kapabacteria bacterium]
MEIWVQAATILALLSFALLCLYAIGTLKDVRRILGLVQNIETSLEKLPSELKEVRMRLLGTLKNMEDTTKNVAQISQKINDDMQSSTGIFAEIDALTRQLQRLREYLQTGIIQPLGNIAITISALSKGTEAFSETLRKPRRHE